MKRFLLAALVAGCSAPEASPPAAKSSGVVSCDAEGRWGPGIAHWLYDPEEKKDRLPANGGARSSCFRDTLPFPQFSWGGGDFEVIQLVFPVGDGLMARYHVMNHGSDAHTVRLNVGQASLAGATHHLIPSSKPSEISKGILSFDLKIEPGASQFVVVATPGAEGRDPNDALDEAVAKWEKLLARPITIADTAALSAYCLDLAGRAMGESARAEAVRIFEERFVKKEGNALRLLGDVPEAWILESIEVKELKTDFGPLTFRHVGFYNSRTLDLESGCAPPGGFLLAVDAKHSAKIDGAVADVKDGLLRIPSGAKRVELARKF